MSTRYLSNKDHVVRYVPWARLRKDENDNVVGVLGAAFKLREKEDYLSATWTEFFPISAVPLVIPIISGDDISVEHCRIASAIGAIRASKLGVRPRSGFAIGNVERIKSACSEANRKYRIRVIHEIAPDNAAHTAIRQWPKDDESLLDLLAEDQWSALVLNKDIV